MHLPELMNLQATSTPMKFRFWKITEISEEMPGTYQRAMSNIFSAAQEQKDTHVVYLLRGTRERVSLYLGVAIPEGAHSDIHEARKNLRAALLGHLPGVQLSGDDAPDESMEDYRHFGVALGVPTAHEDDAKSDEEDFQGVERLIRAMQSSGNDWQIILVARPLERSEIQLHIDQTMTLASKAATWSKATLQDSTNTGSQTNKSYNISDSHGTSDSTADQRGKNKSGTTGDNSSRGSSSGSSSSSSGTSSSTTIGTSESKTITHGTSTNRSEGLTVSQGENLGRTQGFNLEVHDKWNQELLKHLEENLLPRLRKGFNKGLFDCACYLAASDEATFKLLAGEVKSTFQGNIETTTPIEVFRISDKPKDLSSALIQPHIQTRIQPERALVHSLSFSTRSGRLRLGSLLSVDELALMASLPRNEVPGIVRRKNVDFAVSLPLINAERALVLGNIIDHGRALEQSVTLDTAELDKHVFITGVTGAGKTTTCMRLLLESGLPFLVIEPAKTEYRAMLRLREHGHDISIDCYRVGEDPYHTLRINPFQLVHKRQKITAQVSLIQATLSAVFPMEASMPQLVEMAIIRAYEARGWDIHRNENLFEDDPWRAESTAWPTFSDMIAQLDKIIPEQKMGKEFEEKYRGSLVSRLSGLTRGVLGTTLDAPYSMDFNQLIERNVIIELEGLPSPEHKALLMGLILARLAEAMKERHRTQPGHRHLTLIEEAHRLLSNPQPGESENRKNAVETFANLLSEIRKYGEGLMIADQIPNKLVPDVIKNTHIKIVHRLYAEDDRRTLGEAMMLDDEQRNFLPNLQTGEAIIYRGGWHGAVRAKISQGVRTDDSPIAEDELLAQSEHLFWGQRHALQPHLAAVWHNQQAADYARFSVEAKGFLNELLKFAPHYAENKQNQLSQLYAQRLVAQHQRWVNRGLDTSILTLLKAMIQDSRPRLRSDQNNEKGIKNQWNANNTMVLIDVLRNL
ncbi:MAG TPA: ATP-binding protein, partial [bacterium]|nr:ATP-binding protein [bacterium]